MQQDIIGILDKEGTQVVSYTYDSWGKLIAVTGSKKDSIGQKNPFRYRGYYCDVETGLFYVGSRYYDPETCRMVNADDPDVLTASPNALTDKNLYAYCDNNPVMRVDQDGAFWGLTILAGAVIGAAISIGTQMIVEHKSFSELNKTEIISSAVSGALAGSGLGLGWQIAGNAAINTAVGLKNGHRDSSSLFHDASIGAISGAIGGKGVNYKGAISKTIKDASRNIAKVEKKHIAKVAAKKTASIKKSRNKKLIRNGIESLSRMGGSYAYSKRYS